jgi:hypothetical protein
MNRLTTAGSIGFSIFLLLLVFVVGSRAQNDTHKETRALLKKMDRADAKTIKKLFEESHLLKDDLVTALSDEKQISVNAQVIINYSGDADLLKSLEHWRRTATGAIAMPLIKLVEDVVYLNGEGGVTDMVLQYLRLDPKESSARVVATNKATNTLLIEVVIGNVFTEGRHLAVRKDGERWQLLSDNLVWQH